MNPFESLLLMLKIVFDGSTTISEDQYHDVVACMRRYNTKRLSTAIEQTALRAAGFPVTYHPCNHMERIRFCTVFGEPDATLQDLLAHQNAMRASVMPGAEPQGSDGSGRETSCA